MSKKHISKFNKEKINNIDKNLLIQDEKKNLRFKLELDILQKSIIIYYYSGAKKNQILMKIIDYHQIILPKFLDLKSRTFPYIIIYLGSLRYLFLGSNIFFFNSNDLIIKTMSHKFNPHQEIFAIDKSNNYYLLNLGLTITKTSTKDFLRYNPYKYFFEIASSKYSTILGFKYHQIGTNKDSKQVPIQFYIFPEKQYFELFNKHLYQVNMDNSIHLVSKSKFIKDNKILADFFGFQQLPMELIIQK